MARPVRGPARLDASPLTLAESIEPLGGESCVVIDLGRGVLRLGDQRGGAFLGLDQVLRAALLGIGEDCALVPGPRR